MKNAKALVLASLLVTAVAVAEENCTEVCCPTEVAVQVDAQDITVESTEATEATPVAELKKKEEPKVQVAQAATPEETQEAEAIKG